MQASGRKRKDSLAVAPASAPPIESELAAQQEAVPRDYGSLFDAEYFKCGCGPIPYERSSHWLSFFGTIADQLIRSLKPRRVLDAGCAMGFLVEAFWDRGVEARGIDISSYAISKVRRDVQPYCRVASLTEPVQGTFDLVTCIEVLEHMPEAEARIAVENLAKVTDCILFSSTPQDVTEPTHFNVHPTIYWLKLFAEFGFWPDLTFDAGFVAPHALLLRRQSQPLPEEALVLFSEKIRFVGALVERESRIGRLNEEIAGLSKQVEQLRAEREATQAANTEHLGRLSQELHDLRQTVQHLETEREAARTQLREVVDRLSAAEADSAALREATRHLEAERASLQQERREASDRFLRAEVENATLKEAIRHLEGERAGLLQASREAAEHVSRATAENTALQEVSRQLETEREWLQRQLQEASERLSRFAAESAAQAEATRRLEAERASLQRELQTLSDGVAQSSAENAALAESLRQMESLKQELHSIHTSPGWRLIMRYRNWLQAGRARRAWIRNWYDPAVSWLLKKVGFGPRTYHLPRTVPGLPVITGAAIPAPESSRESGPRAPTAETTLPEVGTSLSYEAWFKLTEPGDAQLALQRQLSLCLPYRPKISVLVPVYKVPLAVVQEMVDSVRFQSYDNWELCLLHADTGALETAEFLSRLAQTDERVKVQLAEENLGISGNSNKALGLVTGEFIALLDHDDTLAPFALFEVAKLLNEQPELDFIYSDKDQISEQGDRVDPLFKPCWSQDVMLSANYLTHLCVMRTDLVQAVGGWRPETDGAQDWDLFVRILERTDRVGHIPKVLYHWRRIATSVASTGLEAKPYAAKAQLRTLRDHFRRTGRDADVAFTPEGYLRVRWQLEAGDLVSVIVVSEPGDPDSAALAAEIISKTRYSPLEVIVWQTPGSAEPASGSDPKIRAVTVSDSADLAERLNLAVRKSAGRFCVFVDRSVEVASEDWLSELVGPLYDERVGVVGGKSLDAETGKIRQAGIAFNSGGELACPFAGEDEWACGLFGGVNWYRNWLAIGGACFAIRREVLDRLNGFSEAPAFLRTDVDLCFRVRLDLGFRVVYNPFARFRQTWEGLCEQWLDEEGPARSARYFTACFPGGDPFFNPNLSWRRGRFLLSGPAAERGGAPPGNDYAAESRALVGAFDFSRSLIEGSRAACAGPARGKVEKLTWFIPDFTHPFYGGIYTIFRFAAYFHRAHKVESTFVVLGESHPSQIRSRVRLAFPEVASHSGFVALRDYAQLSQVPASDAAIATLWTTAYVLLRFDRTRRKFYFVQDYEPLFYPAGSTSALVDATYGFGFDGVCNTVALRDLYLRRGGEADYFTPSVDTPVFYSDGPSRCPSDGKSPYVLFCYARPGHPRNCFELLSATLRIVKQRMGDGVRILTAGADWHPAAYGIGDVLENLGVLSYRVTGALYRLCDAGVVMMMTCHPSYLPFELMACGCLVVTNKTPHSSWLLRDQENCLLADSSPTAMAEAIEEGLKNHALRLRITENARRLIQENHSDWDAQAEKIYRYLCRRA